MADSSSRDRTPKHNHLARSLITPSASPPVTSRMTDRVPPIKRPRLAGTPSSTSSASSTLVASSSTSTAVEDIDSARRASTLRVLNVWNQLAERYNKRLDEDDIVDLVSGTIIKDCGVIKGASRDYNIGRFAQAEVEESNSDNDDAQTEADAEQSQDGDTDDVDSPGPFRGAAATAGLSDQLKARFFQKLPPLSATTDADDLSEFLEAERLRREREELIGGEGEIEMSLEDIGNLRKALEDAPPRKKAKAHSAAKQAKEQTPEDKAQENAAHVNKPKESPNSSRDNSDEMLQTHAIPRSARTPPSRIRAQDDESDDELGIWENDEFNAVYNVNKGGDTNASETQRDVIVLSDSDSDPSRPSTPRPPSERLSPIRFSPLPSPPPRAKSKSVPNTPKGPPLRKSSRAKSKTPFRSQRASRSLSPPPAPQADPHQRASHIQLHTPPRSSSAATDNTLAHEELLTTFSIPSASTSRKAPPSRQTPASPVSKPTSSVTPSAPCPTPAKVPKSIKKASGTKEPPATKDVIPKKIPKGKLVPEVVISHKPRGKSMPPPHEELADYIVDDRDRISAKDKGKQKALDTANLVTPQNEQQSTRNKGKQRIKDTERSVSPVVLPPKSARGSGSSKGKQKAVDPENSATPEQRGIRGKRATPGPSDTNSRVKKRKRMVSNESSTGAERETDIPPASSATDDLDDYSSGPRSASRSPSRALFQQFHPYPFSDPTNRATSQPPMQGYPGYPVLPPPPQSGHFDPMHAQMLLAYTMSYMMSANIGQQQPHNAPTPWPPYTPNGTTFPSSSALDSSASATPYYHPIPYPPYPPHPVMPGQATDPVSFSDMDITPPRRPAIARGRSQSRGRRVSFKLDDRKRAHILELGHVSDSEDEALPPRAKSPKTPAKPPSGREREKSIVSESDEEFEEMVQGPPPKGDRAQTPGPSLGRARSSNPPSPLRRGRSTTVARKDRSLHK